MPLEKSRSVSDYLSVKENRQNGLNVFDTDSNMVIEYLKFSVVPESREQFVQKDTEIWTTALASYPGFLGKEVWISPDQLEEVVQVIRWETFEQWQAIPQEDLERIEAQFSEAVGDTYKLLESSRYQVRKFLQS